MTKSLPCISCGKELQQVFDDTFINQPNKALEFGTYGHYGSCVFDPMDGTRLIVNICDDCISKHLEAGVIKSLSKAQASRR